MLDIDELRLNADMNDVWSPDTIKYLKTFEIRFNDRGYFEQKDNYVVLGIERI